MDAQAQTWHYGIVAQWWAEFNVGGPEIARFQAIIEESGQPALDAACGTGRLLVPFLKAGLDVDACDISPDMLAYCREYAACEGFSPDLYTRAMHQLDLPRTYRTIIVCGGIGLGGDRAFDQEAFRRFYDHLEPGGTLACDLELPYNNTDSWHYWTAEARAELPEPPQPRDEMDSERDARLASDGSRIALDFRRLSFDPLDQVITQSLTGLRWRDGVLIEEQEYVLKLCWYFRNELLMMLEQAGFRDITVEGGYSGAPATIDDGILLFRATKPAA